jgi:hypothetical protein
MFFLLLTYCHWLTVTVNYFISTLITIITLASTVTITVIIRARHRSNTATVGTEMVNYSSGMLPIRQEAGHRRLYYDI